MTNIRPHVNCKNLFNSKARELMNSFVIMPDSTIIITDKQDNKITIGGYKAKCIEAVITHLLEMYNHKF